MFVAETEEFPIMDKLSEEENYPQNVLIVKSKQYILYQVNNFTQYIENTCGYVDNFCG